MQRTSPADAASPVRTFTHTSVVRFSSATVLQHLTALDDTTICSTPGLFQTDVTN